MLKIPTKYLLLVNGLLWTAIGVKIALTGVDYYGRLESVRWWYFLLSAAVFAGFWFMFTGVVRKYAARIMSMTEPRTSILKTFSVKGYLISFDYTDFEFYFMHGGILQVFHFNELGCAIL